MGLQTCSETISVQTSINPAICSNIDGPREDHTE